jgi:hypothetical protein
LRKWLPNQGNWPGWATVAFALAFALILALASVPAPRHSWAAGQAQDGLTLQARAVFDAEINTWVPIHVVVTNEGQEIEGEIQIAPAEGAAGGLVSAPLLYAQPLRLPSHSRKQYTLYAFVEGYTHQLDVRLVQAAAKGPPTILAEQRVSINPLDASSLVWAVLSSSPSALNDLAALPPVAGRRPHVIHLDLADLPGQGLVLEGIDALIVHDVDTSLLHDDQRSALRAWVAQGGHLVVCGGPSAAQAAAGLDDLLPLRVTGTRTTAEIGALGDWARAPFLVGVPAVVAEIEPLADHLPSSSQVCAAGCVLAGAPDLPLLIRRRIARGTVDYVALDPELEPLYSWIGRQAMWSRLFSTAMPAVTAAKTWHAASQALADLGRSTSAPNLALPPVWSIMLFLLIYMLAIGPLNFLVLKRVGRRSLAWITVPALVLLFGCAAYGAGMAARGRTALVTQTTIVRAQPASGTAAVDNLVSLYSPRRTSYDVRLPDGALVRPMPSTWVRQAFSGVETPLTVEPGPPTYLRRFDLDIGDMRTFATYALQPWNDLQSELTVNVQSGLGDVVHAEGTIANLGAQDLRDCALLWVGEPIPIGLLAAGSKTPVAVDFHMQHAASSQWTIETLLGRPPAGGERRRAYDRRQAALQSVLLTPTADPTLSTGLALLGWMDDSPAPVTAWPSEEKHRASSSTHTTTLLAANLAFSLDDPMARWIPKRSMPASTTHAGRTTTPYQVYPGDGQVTWTFALPVEGQWLEVQRLFLHVDATDSLVPGFVPPIEIWDTDSQDWISAPLNLVWGANELPSPGRHIGDDGTIQIRVDTDSLVQPVSIDLSALAIDLRPGWGVP